jgi:putative ABC transport system permease protein
MQSLLRNLRFGARQLGKSPGFAITTILALALGIGANTAIFTVTNALLLRPFPYHDPAQLITITVKHKSEDFGITLQRYELMRDFSRSFQSVAVWTSDNLNLTGNGEPVQVPVARVAWNFFALLGVQPQLGRAFTAEEGRPEGRPVVILSDTIWRSRYHADPKIVGQVVMLDSTAHTVVGVLPAGIEFPFLGQGDIFTPRYFELSLMPAERLRTGVGYMGMVARLRPEVTLSLANTEVSVLNQRYREQNPTLPDANPAFLMAAEDLRNLVVGDLRSKVLMLSVAVGLVLLIACANVASLLLSRALARRREVAVRTALGASRGAIFSQMLTESVMLALVAGVVGVGLGWAATQALDAWGATQLPQGVQVGIDGRVLLFTLAASLLSGILFGTIPALQLARVDLNTALRDEGRGASAGRTRMRSTGLLVIGQVGLSLLLLIGAGLLLRSFEKLLHVDPGFDAHNLLTTEISLSTVKYAKPQQQIAFFDDMLRRIGAQPGVESAAVSSALPLSFRRITPVLPEGQPEVALAQRPFVDIEAISPQWFQTMRIPLRAGRAFTAADNGQGAAVVIVNETFARQFWPNQDPLKMHVIVGRRPRRAEVIAVAADVKNRGLEAEPMPQLYLPFPQLAWGDMNLLVRTSVPPLTITSGLRAKVAAVDSDQPLTKIQTVDDLVDSSRAQPRFMLFLVGAFSFTALALAIIGIYGVVSYSVAQRQQEFGIRMALGAERSDVLRLVLRQGLSLALIGIAGGLAAALLLTKLAGSLLYKVGARDPATFVLAPIVFLAIALLACYLPARRATKVDPIQALR